MASDEAGDRYAPGLPRQSYWYGSCPTGKAGISVYILARMEQA